MDISSIRFNLEFINESFKEQLETKFAILPPEPGKQIGKRHVDYGARDIGVSRLLFRDEIRAGGSERVAGHRDEAAGRKSGNYRAGRNPRSEEHTSELQSLRHLVCRLLLEKNK